MDGGAYSRALEEARTTLVSGIPDVMSRLSGATFAPASSVDEGEEGTAGSRGAGTAGVFTVAYLDRWLEVTHPEGRVTQKTAAGESEATVAEAVIVLHYLGRATGPLDLADPVRFQGLPDAAAYVGAFHSHAEVPLAQRFGEDGGAFVRAARALGGAPASSGPRATAAGPGDDPEVLWQVPFLPHLPIGVRLGLADGAMPAECVVMFPRRAGFIHHVEDLAVAGELLSSRLLEAAGDAAGAAAGDEDLAVLVAVYDPMEADIIVGRLRSAGIDATVRHDALSVVYGLTVDGHGKAEVVVRYRDLAEARGALDLETEEGRAE